MGQGHYAALVWGVTGDDRDKVYDFDEDGDSDVAPWANEAIYGYKFSYVKASYESKEPWLGVLAGCTDSIVSERKTGKPADLEYTAMPLASVEKVYAKQIADARESWEKFRRLAADNGVDLPEGQLLLVFDYD